MLDQPLKIEAVHQPDAYVIRVQGELDLGGCSELERALQAAEQTEAARIVVDLEDLTFIDSGAVGSLVAASRRSAANGNRLELTRGRGHPRRVLELMALEQTLPLNDPALCPAIRTPTQAARPRRWSRAEVAASERRA
jgi:anti-sigma B factor antagonist